MPSLSPSAFNSIPSLFFPICFYPFFLFPKLLLSLSAFSHESLNKKGNLEFSNTTQYNKNTEYTNGLGNGEDGIFTMSKIEFIFSFFPYLESKKRKQSFKKLSRVGTIIKIVLVLS